MRKNIKCIAATLLLSVSILISGCGQISSNPSLSIDTAKRFLETVEEARESITEKTDRESSIEESDIYTWNGAERIPAYSGNPYVSLNGNIPYFSEDEKITEAFEIYSDLDSLGRCGVAYANICEELMPTEKRGEIGSVKPSGWHSVKYPELISDTYLYNRCHLIGFQLAGENANPKNLITGTRSLNIDGMLPFENQIADYVKETGNHVLYRVTPIFYENDLVARGVEMEGYSVEDSGDGICFHVFAYNVQSGITIDYATGDSYANGSAFEETEAETIAASSEIQKYILNTRTKKFHLPDCESAKDIGKGNREERTAKREDLIEEGYDPCKICKP